MDEEPAGRAALVHREALQLILLLLGVAAAFFLTRALAASNREIALRDAAEWHRRGQQAMAAGRPADAIAALRRAAAKDSANRQYGLALARALDLADDDEAARRVLLALRDSAPEDSRINLGLARLAASRQDMTEALRFYRNALYAPWHPDLDEARRAVRIELIEFLLPNGQIERAISELYALSRDIPDEVDDHLRLGRLFTRAGDHSRALTQFEDTLRLDEANAEALAAAGEAAFILGRYPLARDYLRRLPDASPALDNLRTIADLVLSRDPVAPRLGARERRRRLLANVDDARQRLDRCLTARTAGQPATEDLDLQAEVDRFAAEIEKARTLEQDTLEMGMELIDRMVRRAVEACGPPSALDQALTLIGRQHGYGAR